MKVFNELRFQIFILWATYFLWSVTQGFVWPFLNLYIYQTSQGDIILTALITAVPSFITIFSVGFWGWCIDKLKNNTFFAMLGLFSAALLYFLGTLITDAFLFFFTYSALSFFINAYVPASQSYTSFQSERSGQSFGNLFAVASIGWFLGTITSGMFYDLLGMVFLFKLGLIVLFIGGILSIFGFRRGKIDSYNSVEEILPSSWNAILRNRVIVIICLVGGVYQLLSSIVTAYFSIYIQEIGGGSFIVGSALALASLTGTGLVALFGRLSEKWGVRKPFIIYSVGGLFVASIICYLLPHPLVVGYIWGGIPFYPGLLTGAYAMLADGSKESDRGKAVGFFNALSNLGLVIGPFCGAWIIIELGMRTNFLVVGFLELVLLIFVIFFVKESKYRFLRKHFYLDLKLHESVLNYNK
ncbi:MAG: MFS transporter [Candidatus Hodarchaeota archaeon]